MKRMIFSLVIVLVLVMMALLAANLSPAVMAQPPSPLSLECLIVPDPPELGQVTNFYAAASGGVQPYFWSWTVNGEEVATEQNTTWTFTAGGTYNVCVNVTDSSEPKKEKTCPTLITITGDLILTCDVSPNPTKVGHVTNFYAAASGGDPPYEWLWTVNGAPIVGGQNTIHTFATAGTYTVCVNVTDSLGTEEQCCTPVTVNEALSLECVISPNPTQVGQVTNFYAAAGGGVPPYEWLWTVNGAEVATTQNTAHTFATGGTYTVCVNVTDSLDNKEQCCTPVTVNEALSPTPSGGGGGGCPSIEYLTVDWEGEITEKPLNSNNRLAVDLLGPSPDGSHSLLLERGTLAPTVNGEQHYLIVIREFEETLPLPENTMVIVAIDATPTGAVFDRDVFLTLGFDQSELPENALNATMAYYDDVSGGWVPLESELDELSGVAKLTLSAPINHFSIFGVLVELAPTPTLPSPAHFVASGLNIVASVEKMWESVTFVTKTGESVTITANVLNDGGQEGTYTVELKLNGETVDTEIVTLGAGQSQPVSFTVSGLDYGQYEVEVAGLSGDFTTSRTVTWWLIVVIIVAIGLISWGVVWERRGGRRSAQER